jgi:hypothetical protein
LLAVKSNGTLSFDDVADSFTGEGDIDGIMIVVYLNANDAVDFYDDNKDDIEEYALMFKDGKCGIKGNIIYFGSSDAIVAVWPGDGEEPDAADGSNRTKALQLVAGAPTIAAVLSSIQRYGDRYGVWYSFTPASAGTYAVESSAATNDPYVYLFNSVAGNHIAVNDDGGYDDNFRLSYSLAAGTTYYYFVANYDKDASSGTITFVFTSQS